MSPAAISAFYKPIASPKRILPWVVTTALIGLVGVPLLFIALQAIFPRLGEGLLVAPFSMWLPTLADPRVLQLSLNTLVLGVSVALVAGALGGMLGVIRGLSEIPYARAWDIVMLMPLMIPPYIATLGWIVVLQPRGYLQQVAGFHLGPFLFSFPGLVFVMASHLFPAVYFAVSRSIEASGGQLAEAARMSGASAFDVFRRITLPLALPAIGGALLLVFASTIEEYGTPAILASQSNFEVLTTAIDHRVADWPIDLPGASCLSIILVLLALMAYSAQQRMIEGRSFETIGGKTQAYRAALRGWRLGLALAVLASAALVTIGLPLLGILSTAFTRTFSGGLSITNLSTRNFEQLFSNVGGAMHATAFSLALATGTAIVTAIIGVSAALVSRREGSGVSFIRTLTALPNAVPGVVVAVGLILAWNQPWLPATVYGTWVMLLLAYSCILLPYPVRYAFAALTQISPDLEAAAMMAGANRIVAFRRIVLPLLWPSVFAAMMLVFSIASRELVASILLAPVGTHTMATFVWKQFEQGSLGLGMAMSVIALVVNMLVMAAISAALLGRGRT